VCAVPDRLGHNRVRVPRTRLRQIRPCDLMSAVSGIHTERQAGNGTRIVMSRPRFSRAGKAPRTVIGPFEMDCRPGSSIESLRPARRFAIFGAMQRLARCNGNDGRMLGNSAQSENGGCELLPTLPGIPALVALCKYLQ
jgi:hypothetical protein